MPTPTIQTLVTDAQQVLNLDSISAVRSVVAVALANANTGTPLNPNLTTQQLWNEFYQVVTKPKSDIESIIANQLMKFLYAPPAPGGVGSNKQVIFNDGGVLAGDPDFQWDKTLNRLAIVGSQTITGNLTVDTNTFFVDSTNNRVGIGTASPADVLHAYGGNVINESVAGSFPQFISKVGAKTWSSGYRSGTTSFEIWEDSSQRYTIGNGGTPHNWYIGGSPAMTLNSTGLGIGVTPSAWNSAVPALQVKGVNGVYGAGSSELGLTQNNFYNASGQWIYGTTAAAGRYSISGGTHYWHTATSGTINTEITQFASAKMTLDVSGNLLTGGKTTATANGGDVQVSSGITFPATQVAKSDANTLDDYEEGTFTATIKGSVSDPTVAVTASGRYTKVGRQVSVQIEYNNVDTTGASGSVSVSGLPFLVGLGSSGSVISYLTATFTETLSAFAGGNSTVIDIYSVKSNSAWIAATHNAGTGRYLWLNVTYTV